MSNFDINVDGLDETIDTLGEMADRAQELDGENEVSLPELFPPEFMQRYTEFGSIEEFFEQSPWDVKTQEDLEAIPDDEADQYVAGHTQFSDSDEMAGTAIEEWTARQLGFEK